MPDPFDRVVAEERLHPNFVQVRDHATHAPTRGTIRDAFGTYDDPDGNFLEQFQTTGFDARVWELYLDVAFKSMEFDVSRPDRPDFMLAKAGESVATEAVTSNPTHTAGSRLRQASARFRHAFGTTSSSSRGPFADFADFRRLLQRA